mgnify:FL=1
MKRSLWGIGAVCTVMLSSPAMAVEEPVVSQVPACYTEAEDMKLEVNGTEVPIIEFTDIYNHAGVAFQEAAEITITVDEPIESYSISPLAYGIEGEADGNKLTFHLDEPEYLLIKINEEKELALAADLPETDVPDSHGEGIYNIGEEPYNGLGSTPEEPTDALQRAIDDASAAGGGIVYVPNGVYYTKNIVLKSNISLYLEPSAVIRGTGNWEDYIYHFHKDSLKMDGTWFITNEPGAENIKVYGRGFLDGNGHAMREQGHLNNLFFTMQLSGLEIDGVTFKDSGGWMVMINRSDNAVIKNVKFFNENNQDYENDAIDICESQEVLVQHAIAISEDDTYSTKTWEKETDIAENWTGEPEELNNVVFDDCLGWSRCCTFKVGDGAVQPQKNITFQNSYSYKSMAALKLTPAYGDYYRKNSYVENVTFDNIDIEGFWPRSGSETISMWLQLEIKNANIPVYNTIVRNINVRDLGPAKSRLRGQGDLGAFEGVVLENITVPGLERPASTLEEMNILDTTDHYRNLVILPEPPVDDTLVLYDDFSTGLDQTKDSENVQFDNFKGYNGGGIIPTGDGAAVVYDAKLADHIQLTVNSYKGKFPFAVEASDDSWGESMDWHPVSVAVTEEGNYSAYEAIKDWNWHRYEGDLEDQVKYVKISLPIPGEKLWWILLDDVKLYSDQALPPEISFRPGQESLRMKSGTTETLYPIVKRGEDAEIRYTSSDENVAFVDENGVIKALEQGHAEITAVIDKTDAAAVMEVTVYEEIEEISISQESLILDKGDTYAMEVEIFPEDSAEELTWFSTDSSVVSVTSDGQLNALKYGEATIVCETENHRRVSCQVEVIPNRAVRIIHDTFSSSNFSEESEAAEITENLEYDNFKGVTDGGIKRNDNQPEAYVLYQVENPKYIQYQLNYYTKTSDIQDQLEVFQSADGENWTPVEMEAVDYIPDIHTDWDQVTMFSKEPMDEGTQYVRVSVPQIIDLGSSNNRYWALIIEDIQIFTDKLPAESITVLGPSVVTKGTTAVYQAKIQPESAGDTEIFWSVTDLEGRETSSAEIDPKTGHLKAVETGRILVKASADDGSQVFGTLEVEITEDPILAKQIVIEGRTQLGYGDRESYYAVIFPENADNHQVSWGLEDLSEDGIAVISEDGVVETGHMSGSFVVVASASDAGRASGRLKVKVSPEENPSVLVKEIEIRGQDTVKVGEKSRYRAAASPSDASRKEVVWSVESSDGQASIDQNGVLTGEKPGEVTIIAAAVDGSGVTAEKTVEIVRRNSSSGSSSGNTGGGVFLRKVKRIYPATEGRPENWRKDEFGWWMDLGDNRFARDEWKLVNGLWYYFNSDGYMATGWLRLNDQWYYLKPDGAMAVGWIQDKNQWYYLTESGVMAVNTVTPDGYYVGADGRWQTVQ